MAGALLSTPDVPAGTPLLGIDIGGTGLKVGIVLTGSDPVLLGSQVLSGHPVEEPARVVDRLTGAAHALLRAHGISPGDVFSVGVGCAGLIDTANGVLRMCPNLPAWRDVPLRRGIEEKIGRPVRLVNDAEAFLQSEWQFGAARGTSNAVFLTIGTGVGGGLVLGGRAFRGTTGLGAEIGHMSVDLDGPPLPLREPGLPGDVRR
jgi:glucokinase